MLIKTPNLVEQVHWIPPFSQRFMAASKALDLVTQDQCARSCLSFLSPHDKPYSNMRCTPKAFALDIKYLKALASLASSLSSQQVEATCGAIFFRGSDQNRIKIND